MKAGGAFVSPECLGLGEGTVDLALALTSHVTRDVGNGAEKSICVAGGRGGGDTRGVWGGSVTS